MSFPLMPFSPSAVGDPVDFAYLATLRSSVDQTNYTFSGVNLGNGATSRIIVVLVQGVATSNRGVSTCTVQGISATQIAVESSTNTPGGLFVAEVPSGASGDIVVGFNGSMSDCAISVYRGTGLDPTPVDWELKSDGGSNSETLTVDVVAGGAVASFALRGNANNIIWTGLTQDNEEEFVYQTGFVTTGRIGAASEFPVPATVSGKTYTVAASGGVRFDNITISLQPLV